MKTTLLFGRLMFDKKLHYFVKEYDLVQHQKEVLSKVINFDAGRTAISSKAFLCEKDFDLDISEFFYDERERELAKALKNRGIEIGIPEMGRREADILLPKMNAQIEVTTIMPVKIGKHKNNAHGTGVHINARLCEGFVRVTNKKIDTFFVVVHKDWMEHRWVKDLNEMIKPKVVLVPTDFKNNWAEKATEMISSQSI